MTLWKRMPEQRSVLNGVPGWVRYRVNGAIHATLDIGRMLSSEYTHYCSMSMVEPPEFDCVPPKHFSEGDVVHIKTNNITTRGWPTPFVVTKCVYTTEWYYTLTNSSSVPESALELYPEFPLHDT